MIISDGRSGRFRIRPIWIGLVVGVVLLQWLARSDAFPALWDTVFSDPIDQFRDWVRANRQIHPVFTAFFIPVSTSIEWGLTTIESFLLWIPWFVLPLSVFLVIFRSGDLKTAIIATLAMIYPGLIGLWESTMETLSLMTIAVLISLAIGIPLGVWAARSSRGRARHPAVPGRDADHPGTGLFHPDRPLLRDPPSAGHDRRP